MAVRWIKAAREGSEGAASRSRARLRRTAAALAAPLVVIGFVGQALAQCGNGPFVGPPPNCGTVPGYTGNGHVAGQAALIDSGGRLLQHLGTWLAARDATSDNPLGGGADAAGDEPRYRAWFEGTALRSRFDRQGDFPGDRRHSAGGVAGLGVTLARGLTVGLAIDQSRTTVDVAGSAQSGWFDLTQVAAMAGYESGPWNFGATLLRGFADVHSSRTDAFGTSTAAYGARLWGAMGEASYYLALPNHSRIVPKLSVDWLQSRTDAFAETGGAPVTGSAVTARRARLLLGGEIGRSWLVRRVVMDASAYGRLVDNLSQDAGTLQIGDPAAGALPRLVGGLLETKYGADAGAAIAARLSGAVRLYALYDGRFRGNFSSHSGTIGAEWRW